MIEWIRQAHQVAQCPICQTTDNQTLLLKVTSQTTGQTLDLYTCSGCESHFYYPFVRIPPRNTVIDRYAQCYMEVGAGIPSIIKPIIFMNVPKGVRKKYIGGGCGFGYSVDYTSRELEWDAVGLEPSPMGVVGKSLLKVPIYNDFFENLPFLQSTAFDVMYTSEVLEHVDDPIAFLQMLRSRLAPQGMLITATPNAETVNPDTGISLLMAILSPHSHTVLFSEKALRHVLEKLSLPHMDLVRHGHQLVAHASESAFELDRNEARANFVYLEYLVSAASRHSDQAPLLIGFLSRAMKMAVSMEMFPLAESIERKLVQAIRRAYKIDIYNENEIRNLLAPLSAFVDLGTFVPYSLFSVYYYIGCIAMNAGRYTEAAKYFNLGFDISKKFLEIGSRFFPEADELLWQFKFMMGLSLYRGGKVHESAIIMKSILAVAHDSGSRFYSPPRKDLLNKVYPMFQRQ